MQKVAGESLPLTTWRHCELRFFLYNGRSEDKYILNKVYNFRSFLQQTGVKFFYQT